MDSDRFVPVNSSVKETWRKEYGFELNEFILIYAAEFIRRKNHRFIIDAMPELLKVIPELKLIFAGTGNLEEREKHYAGRKGLIKHKCITDLYHSEKLRLQLSKNAQETVQKFSIHNTMNKMSEIFSQYL